MTSSWGSWGRRGGSDARGELGLINVVVVKAEKRVIREMAGETGQTQDREGTGERVGKRDRKPQASPLRVAFKNPARNGREGRHDCKERRVCEVTAGSRNHVSQSFL